MWTLHYSEFICLLLFLHSSFFFLAVYVITFSVQCSAEDSCCGWDFSAQASKELSSSAHIAVVLRTISACHTYLSRTNTSRLHIKLDKQEFISNILFCQAWKWYVFKHICIYYWIFYWLIFLSYQRGVYYTFPLHDDTEHINNSLQAFTSVPEVISKQSPWMHTVNSAVADESYISQMQLIGTIPNKG